MRASCLSFGISYGHTASKFARSYFFIDRRGNVKVGDFEASIHKASAKFLNRSNNNGWDYFWCEYNGNFVDINSLRYLADKKGGLK